MCAEYGRSGEMWGRNGGDVKAVEYDEHFLKVCSSTIFVATCTHLLTNVRKCSKV